MYIFRTPAKTVSSREKCSSYVNFNLKNPTSRSSHWKCCTKNVFLKISQNSQKNTRIGVSFLIKLQVLGYNFVKREIPTQVFFCKFYERFLMFFCRVHPGDCFWICLLFFNFRLVLLLHFFVKFGVSVLLGCRVIKKCISIYIFL